MNALSSPDSTPDRRQWRHHHRQTVHRTGVEGHIVTTGWYAAGIDGRIITAGWYAKPVSKDTSSLPDGYAGPVVVRYRHRRMVRWTDGGKMPSLSALPTEILVTDRRRDTLTGAKTVSNRVLEPTVISFLQ
jgi:hypothetical protein